jgi:hypothetical protein
VQHLFDALTFTAVLLYASVRGGGSVREQSKYYVPVKSVLHIHFVRCCLSRVVAVCVCVHGPCTPCGQLVVDIRIRFLVRAVRFATIDDNI